MKYSDKLVYICNNNNTNVITCTKKFKELLKLETSFLDESFTYRERLWFVRNNRTTHLTCPICDKINVHFNLKTGKIQTCSKSCSDKLRVSTRCKIDPETGLNSYEIAQQKRKKTLAQIDPNTGLTRQELNTKKTIKSKLKIDPKTGLNGYQSAIIKGNETKNKIDPKTGLTGHQTATKKANETKLKIDPKTGLNGYQSAIIKGNETKNKIDPKTGLTGLQLSGIKIQETKSINTFKKRSNAFPVGYKLLTTESEYKNSKLLKYECDKCNSIRESYWSYIRCTTCYPYTKSIGEHEVLKFCGSFGTSPHSNTRQIIQPLELDIYLPDHNLAIEYNGLFWHSSYSMDSENRDYHLIKTELCQEKGIQLFHIFENEWQDPQKQNIWKSIIRNRLGQSTRLYARKTTVKPVTSGDKSQFLDENHLQGNCQSSVNLGLYMDGELVSVMTFGRSRYDKKVEWELLRFCNKIGYSVVGGAGKLLKAFRREYDGSIISYADKRRSVGNLYEKLGFELSHETGPNYFYYKEQGLESRVKYQKHKLEAQLDVYDGELTESENMYNNGYRKIYDCGNSVWIYE